MSIRIPPRAPPAGNIAPAAPSPVAGATTTTSSSTTDRFESGSASLPGAVSTATASTSGGAGALTVRLQDHGDLRARVDMLKARIAVAVAVLPDHAEAGMVNALTVSAERLAEAHREGRITDEEAQRSAAQMEDMVNAFLAIQQGRVEVVRTDVSAYNAVDTWDVTTTGGDTLRISVRADGVVGGEARVKIQGTVNDGAPVPAAQRLMIRFDLAGSGGHGAVDASWDVEFGAEKPPPGGELLDKRIHGILLDAQGQPVMNRGGRTVADHHFSQGVPDALEDPVAFKKFTEEFLANVLAGDTTPG